MSNNSKFKTWYLEKTEGRDIVQMQTVLPKENDCAVTETAIFRTHRTCIPDNRGFWGL